MTTCDHTTLYPVGQSVDVLHTVTDSQGQNREQFWVGGYSVADPSRKMNKFQKAAISMGKVPLVRSGRRSRVIVISPQEIRIAQPGSVSMAELYRVIPISGKRDLTATGVTQTVVLTGVTIESEVEDLTIGLSAPTEEE